MFKIKKSEELNLRIFDTLILAQFRWQLGIPKHFFDVSGFVFVLALDEKQLESSVNCLFGTNNFEGYKRKFINNTFLLPAPDRKAFTEFLYDKFGMAILIEKIQNDNRDLVFKIRTDSDCDMI